MRLRWYKVTHRGKARAFLSALVAHGFNRGSEIGFLPLTHEGQEAKFRFLWRTSRRIDTIDAEGLPETVEVATVDYHDFLILPVKDGHLLELEEPPRSVSRLVSVFEQLIDGPLSVRLLIPSATPRHLFSGVEGSRLVGRKVVGAVLGRDLVARVEMASKQGMTPDGNGLLSKIHHKIESSTYELSHRGLRGQVTIVANGTVKIVGALAPRIRTLIERDMAEMGRKVEMKQ